MPYEPYNSQCEPVNYRRGSTKPLTHRRIDTTSPRFPCGTRISAIHAHPSKWPTCPKCRLAEMNALSKQMARQMKLPHRSKGRDRRFATSSPAQPSHATPGKRNRKTIVVPALSKVHNGEELVKLAREAARRRSADLRSFCAEVAEKTRAAAIGKPNDPVTRDNVTAELGKLLDEAGLVPYGRAPHPTSPGYCVHGVKMAVVCDVCKADAGVDVTPIPPPRGNCYVTCEALYHLLGGVESGWEPMTIRHEGDTHWFLTKVIYSGHAEVLDPTASQFKTAPDYSKARGCGFLTKEPSKRARALMERMLWQTD